MSFETNKATDSRPSAAVARMCLNFYEHEIYGGGVASAFDCGPDSLEQLVGSSISKHLQDPGGLQRSLEAFGRYTAILEAFVPFTVTESVPDYSSGNPQATREIQRRISPSLLERYSLFHRALGYYAQIVTDFNEGSATHDDLVDAAISLCKIERPGQWDPESKQEDEGYYSNTIRDINLGLYLEAFLKESRSQQQS